MQILLAIDPHRVENGCLKVYPGSHKLSVVTMETVTVVALEVSWKLYGELVVCPTVSAIAVVIDDVVLNESGYRMTMCHFAGLLASTVMTWKYPVDGPAPLDVN